MTGRSPVVTSPRYRTIPAIVCDSTVDIARRRHVLYHWYRAEQQRAARPRVMVMRVYADNQWWWSSPGRTVAGELLGLAVAPKPPPPSPLSLIHI